MAILPAKPKSGNDFPFHLLPMVYKLRRLGLDDHRSNVITYNVWMWCGGTMPYSAEELLILSTNGSLSTNNSFVTFSLDKVLNKTYKHNKEYFNNYLREHK